MTLSLELDEATLTALRARAEAEGDADPETLVRRLVMDFCAPVDRRTPGEKAVERMSRFPIDAEAAYRFIEEGRSEV